ncbi:MAG: carbamoyl phosphate synthase small subunit [Syntrophomonas sp.]
MTAQKGYLVLEDGSVFQGILMGKITWASGEVVFNTSMVGYDQVISDPSYAGQIVVMTYPLIGNYGLNTNSLESNTPWLRGLVVRELCPESGSHHYQQQMGLEEYLLENNLPCLTGVDTRAITRVLRTHGTMGGVIVDSLEGQEEILKAASSALLPPSQGYVMQVTSSEINHLGSGSKRIVVMDFGSKKSIITSLLERGCEVFVVPAASKAEDIMDLKPNGIVLSNGPGDPQDCPYAIKTIASLVGKKPIMGICLGHQLLALAMGAKTYKMTFGHRGGNHPVKNLLSGRVYITSQNHGYAVDENSLTVSGLQVSFRNLNDGSVEGLMHPGLDLMSVQFHPEAAPGPEDTQYLFDDFLSLVG